MFRFVSEREFACEGVFWGEFACVSVCVCARTIACIL